MQPITLGDIAEILDMTRQGADKLVKREATFPAPVGIVVGRTRIWEREDVERWAREQGRIK